MPVLTMVYDTYVTTDPTKEFMIIKQKHTLTARITRAPVLRSVDVFIGASAVPVAVLVLAVIDLTWRDNTSKHNQSNKIVNQRNVSS